MMQSVEIVIHFPESLINRDKVLLLAYGIEEEGLPFKLMETTSSSAHENANCAAALSSLDVGIGVGDDWKIVTRHSRFDKDSYLFEVKADQRMDLKAYGANAARLIKGVPFKSISGG